MYLYIVYIFSLILSFAFALYYKYYGYSTKNYYRTHFVVIYDLDDREKSGVGLPFCCNVVAVG